MMSRTENRLRKSLSKSRELLSQLENEYKKIKGDENKSARNSLVIDHSWLDKDFDELLQTLSNDKNIPSDPHDTLAFLTNNNTSSPTISALAAASSWKIPKKDNMPPLPSGGSPRARRHQGQSGSEGRNIFSFFQKKGRSQSLSGTEAIKIVLPVTPENDLQANPQKETSTCGMRRFTYESAALEHRPPGRCNRSNSIPSEVPQSSNGSALSLDLVGILKKTRSKSLLSKSAYKENHDDNHHYVPGYATEYRKSGGEIEGERSQGENDGEEESGKQMRSLSLPKSFLSDRYGLTGFKAALP
ncbi:hypothetical protein SK128_012037, partial [Halocaridina rubra]